MDITQITPDETVFWQWNFVRINTTLVSAWAVMALLVVLSWWATRNLSTGHRISRTQAFLETAVSFVSDQIREAAPAPSRPLTIFVGTLFLFAATANLLTIVPGYVPTTASLSTTAALALLVFVAVPVFGVAHQGLGDYLRRYVRPTPVMLPFHVIGELSRTLALAVRLFGNVMSGTKIVAILLAITPLFFPIVMRVLGLITGLIQAYILAVLALVYISSGMRVTQVGTSDSGAAGKTSGKENHDE
jgi:F-type H+-transporting ATPase subunit a